MNRDDTSDVSAFRGRREGGWDLRVVFVERRKRWWWNAWQAATDTELYGFAENRTAAWTAMSEAIGIDRPPDQLGERRRGEPCDRRRP